jgi:hypothetical protein
MGLPYFPTLIVDSGGGYHCYWYLRETVQIDDANRQAVIDVQHWWVVMNGGDIGVSDITRVYRVIGSKNMKPGWKGEYPTVTAIEYDPNRRYDYAVLAEVATDWHQATQQTAQYRYEPAPIYQNGNGAAAGQVRELFNQRYGVADLLQASGYKLKYKTGTLARMTRPGGDKPSVTVLPPDGVRPEIAVAHNTADPLFRDGKGHDAYSVAQVLTHRGDWKAAYVEAKKAVGMWEEQPVKRCRSTTLPRLQVRIQRLHARTRVNCFHESADDEGNAQCVYRLYAGRFLYTNAYQWMHNVGHPLGDRERRGRATPGGDSIHFKTRRKAAVDADAESIM